MPEAALQINKPYIVPEDQLSIGARGAVLLRVPTRIELFPNSTCIEKIWLFIDEATDYVAIKVFFVKTEPKTNRKWQKRKANNYSVYEYDGAFPGDLLQIFEMLVQARDSGESVGRIYNKFLRNNPIVGPAYAVA